MGFSRLTNNTKQLAPWLAWDMAARGQDAWGATDGREVYRALGSVIDGWHEWVKMGIWKKWKTGIVHTRAASVGKGDEIENAHPFVVDKQTGELGFVGGEGKVIGIHNGSVSNWEELNTKYGRGFKVDSIHLFANIAQGFPTNEIRGYGALAWYEGGELWLAKFNGGDLHVVRLESGEVVFCSQLQTIKDACGINGVEIEQEYEIHGDTKYRVGIREDEGKDELFEEGVMTFGGVGGTVYAPAVTYGGSNYGEDRWNETWRRNREATEVEGNTVYRPPYVAGGDEGPRKDTCKKCYVGKLDRKKRLVCERCMTEFEDRFCMEVLNGKVDFYF